MHNSAWAALFGHIPAEQQNKYMLVTSSGTEIAIQSFLRVEAELVVLKGRLSGSQEQGRVFFIPYKHIDYLGTALPTKDTEFQEVFGSLEFPVAPEPSPLIREEEPELPEVVPAGSNGLSAGDRSGIRSEVLERFRSIRPTAPSSSLNLPRPQP